MNYGLEIDGEYTKFPAMFNSLHFRFVLYFIRAIAQHKTIYLRMKIRPLTQHDKVKWKIFQCISTALLYYHPLVQK